MTGLLAEPDGSFMRVDGSDLVGYFSGLEPYPGAHAVYTTARLTAEQFAVFEATLEAPDDATAEFDPDVRLPGPVVWYQREVSPVPPGHNVRVVFRPAVSTAARSVDGFVVVPAGTPVRVVWYEPAADRSDGVAVLHVMEKATGPDVFDAEALRRVRDATLARLSRYMAGENPADNPVVRPRLHNVFGRRAAEIEVLWGPEVELWFGWLGDAAYVAELLDAMGAGFVEKGLMRSPQREAHHASYHRPYTDRPDDFRFESESVAVDASEFIGPKMKDKVQWWLRFFKGMGVIKENAGIPVPTSNGNLHVGIPYFGGRPGAADVTRANLLLDLFAHYGDPLYRIMYYWSEADQVGYVNDPMIPRLTDLATDKRRREFAVNLEHLRGSEKDRGEFRFLSPTHEWGPLQAGYVAVVGLMVWAWLGGRPPEGSTPQRLGVNFSRSAARKELATGGHDEPLADSGEAAFLEFVNAPPFRGQPDVQQHLAEQFVAGQWRSVDLPALWSAVHGDRRLDLADVPVAHNLYDLIRQARSQGMDFPVPPKPPDIPRNLAEDLWKLWFEGRWKQRLESLADYLGIAGENTSERLRTLESAVRRGRHQRGFGGDLDRMLTLDQVRDPGVSVGVVANYLTQFDPRHSGEFVSPVALFGAASVVVVGRVSVGDGRGPVLLNGEPPQAERLERMWSDLAWLRDRGVRVLVKLGGPEDVETFAALERDFDGHVRALVDLARARGLQGVDIDPSAGTGPDVLERLVVALRSELGPHFSVVVSGSAAMFDPLNGVDPDMVRLFNQVGEHISWMTLKTDALRLSGIPAGIPADKLVVELGTKSSTSRSRRAGESSGVDSVRLGREVQKYRGKVPGLAGFAGSDYLDASDNGEDWLRALGGAPWLWFRQLHAVLDMTPPVPALQIPGPLEQLAGLTDDARRVLRGTVGKVRVTFPDGTRADGAGAVVQRLTKDGASDLVMTASHNIYDRRFGGLATDVDFLPNGHAENEFGGVWEGHTWEVLDYFLGGFHPELEYTDLAMIVLRPKDGRTIEQW